MKLFGGFSIALILAINASYAGYYSLAGVADREAKSAQVNNLALRAF